MIIRAAHDSDHPAVEVVRSTAQNKALSYEALGMLTYLLSQADDWIIGVDDLIREGCGRDKAYRILKELTDAGYLTHVRSAAGQHKPPVWAGRTVYERPFTEMPELVTPNPDLPDLVKRSESVPVAEMPETVKPSETRPDSRAQQTDLNALTTEQKDKDNAAGAIARAREESSEQPNAYRVWEQEMGVLTPTIADAIKDWEANYPSNWPVDAIRTAKLSGGSAPNYVQKILDRWRRDGKDSPRPSESVKPKPVVKLTAPTIPSTSVGAPRIRRETHV